MTTSKVTEIGVTFFKAGGHKHDGITSTLIDTSKYSIFDFDLAVDTGGADVNRESRRQSNRARFDQYVGRFVTTQVLEPAGIVLPADSVRGVNIGANEITAKNIAADTITANEIAANTITANEIATGTLTSNLLVTDFAVVNSTIRSNNFTYDSNTGIGTGWAIYSNGDAILNNGIFSGKIDVGGFDTSSFHVDLGGNVWSGAANFASGTFKVYSNGQTSLAAGGLVAYSNGAVNIAGTTSISGNLNVTGNSIQFSPSNASARMTVNGSITTTGTVDTGGLYSSASITGDLNLWMGNQGNLTSGFLKADSILEKLFISRSTNSTVPVVGVLTDQIVQIKNYYNYIDSASPKGSLAGIGFECGPGGGFTTGGSVRHYRGDAGPSEVSVANYSGADYGNILARAHFVSSSADYKTNIEYLPVANRHISIEKIKKLKPARWSPKNPQKYIVGSEKFRDINKRWVAKGRTPLILTDKNCVEIEHDCEILECKLDSNGRCNNKNKASQDYGFIAEDIGEVFPEAAAYDLDNKAAAIDYAKIVFGLVEVAQELLEKVEKLEQKIDQPSD